MRLGYKSYVEFQVYPNRTRAYAADESAALFTMLIINEWVSLGMFYELMYIME